MGTLDKRLIARGDLFLSRMVENQTCIVRKLSKDWKEQMGFWRWLSNDKVSVNWLLGRIDQSVSANASIKGCHVLSIQDSSTISFFSGIDRNKKGLSRVGTVGDMGGFILHPSLLLDADDGRCLGLGNLSIHNQWVSSVDEEAARNMAAEEKKTGRWLSTGEQVRAHLTEAQQVTHVADREADFYEMLLEFGQNRRKNEHLIVRVNQDRLLGQMQGRGRPRSNHEGDEQVQTGLGLRISFPNRTPLSKLVEQLPVMALWTLNLPANPKRKARLAQVKLRYAQQVPLRRPKNLYKRTYQAAPLPLFIRMNVIDLQEELPPGADYQPLHWRIYTSHPLENNEQAKQVIQWYCWRWKIELLFASVKAKGLNLEFALLEHAERLKKLAILVLMAAIQVIQLIQARDGESKQSILGCFSKQEAELIRQINPKVEGNTLKQKNPHPSDSLAYAAWVIGRLGGWSGYKTHRPPGIKTMARGLERFFQIKNSARFFDP
ncbi:MAG: IS4 family transposase [Saprospiraceae bacterium]